MDTHGFPDQVKVQRFCLTLVGEARLWYESLRPIKIDWVGLQNIFRQQYSKIGNTREQLFHAWRSFHFDEKHRNNRCLCKSHKTSCYTLRLSRATKIRTFQKHTPTKLYQVLFSIMDLRQVVETAKRILTKEKIDRQLAGQTSSTPFMNIRDGINKRVTFDMTDSVEQKIDKLRVMMVKLVTEDEGQSKPFKP